MTDLLNLPRLSDAPVLRAAAIGETIRLMDDDESPEGMDCLKPPVPIRLSSMRHLDRATLIDVADGLLTLDS